MNQPMGVEPLLPDLAGRALAFASGDLTRLTDKMLDFQDIDRRPAAIDADATLLRWARNQLAHQRDGQAVQPPIDAGGPRRGAAASASASDRLTATHPLGSDDLLQRRTKTDIGARIREKITRPDPAQLLSELEGICTADTPPAGDVAINSLLYVSRSRIEDQDYRHALLAIQRGAVARNNEYGVTGMLIATRDHFAQFLEGPIEGLYQVMNCIMRDPRHYGIVIADTHPFNRRLFPNWRMACFTPNSPASRRVGPLLDGRNCLLSPSEAEALIGIMQSTAATVEQGAPGFEGDA